MDHVDRIAHRMSLSAIGGFFVGASVSTLRGTPHLVRTSLTVAAASAICATACLATERLAYVALSSYSILPPNSASRGDEGNSGDSGGDGDCKSGEQRLYASHAAGGILGGALAGGALRQRPIPGILMFVPVMLIVAAAEVELERYREERLKNLLRSSGGFKAE